MITYGRCPRCTGQLYTDSDIHGTFLSCLQCGYLQPIDSYDPEAKRQPPRAAPHHTRGLRGQTYKQRHR